MQLYDKKQTIENCERNGMKLLELESREFLFSILNYADEKLANLTSMKFFVSFTYNKYEYYYDDVSFDDEYYEDYLDEAEKLSSSISFRNGLSFIDKSTDSLELLYSICGFTKTPCKFCLEIPT